MSVPYFWNFYLVCFQILLSFFIIVSFSPYELFCCFFSLFNVYLDISYIIDCRLFYYMQFVGGELILRTLCNFLSFHVNISFFYRTESVLVISLWQSPSSVLLHSIMSSVSPLRINFYVMMFLIHKSGMNWLQIHRGNYNVLAVSWVFFPLSKVLEGNKFPYCLHGIKSLLVFLLLTLRRISWLQLPSICWKHPKLFFYIPKTQHNWNTNYEVLTN